MSQNGHFLFRSSKNLRHKAMEPEWDHEEKKKQINTPKDPGRLNVKAAQGLKRDAVILKELFRDAYWRKYPHLNEKNSPMMLRQQKEQLLSLQYRKIACPLSHWNSLENGVPKSTYTG